MTYFVLVYDRSAGKLVQPIEYFDAARREDALERRFELEVELRGTDYEIVVLGAESEDAIRRTHGRYFKSVDELLAEMVSPRLAY